MRPCLALELREALLDLRVDEVRHVFAVDDLRHHVVLPVVVLQDVALAQILPAGPYTITFISSTSAP